MKDTRDEDCITRCARDRDSMKGDDGRCLAAGIDGYVSKPIQPDEFFDVLERVLVAVH